MTNYWVKTILSIVVISFLIFYPMQIARSAAAMAYILKEFGLDLIARVIARTFLSKMVNQVTDFISKKGRDAGPSFVQDWRNFLENAQYRGEDITRAIIGDATMGSNATICQYLRGPLGSVFGAVKEDKFNPSKYRVGSLQYYNQRNKCTLPSNFNVSLFKNDFSAGGGWAAWDKLIQPQNNFFGVYADSLDELGRQRSFEENIDRSETESADGFTSKRSGADDSGCEGTGMNTSCLILGQIMTPGKILEDAGANLNTGEFDWLTGSDELSEVLLNVATALVGRLGSFVGAKIQEEFTADTSQGDALMEKARQDCVEACINTYCQPQLPLCVYEIDPITLEEIPVNSPCDPDDAGQRNVCIADCQAKGCD